MVSRPRLAGTASARSGIFVADEAMLWAAILAEAFESPHPSADRSA